LHILRILQEEAMKGSSAVIHVQVPVDVATFLLNEKRADIHRIESRLKVSITLIPNPHLETPNYSISRIKADDLHGEPMLASYKMVEKPATDKAATPTAEQQKATRAQAVVQGITPAQPAPMKAEEVKPSFMGRFFGWFKGFGAEETPPAKPATPSAKPRPAQKRDEPRAEGGNNKRRERGDRPERGERPEKGERGEKGERNEQNRRDRNPPAAKAENAAKPQQEARPAVEAREPRPPKPPREPRPPRVPEEKLADKAVEKLVEKPVLETPITVSVETEEEAATREGSRRRGRRGGRRERERRDGGAPEATPINNEEPIVVQVGTAKRKPSEYVALPKSMREAAALAAAQQALQPVVEVNEVAVVEVTPVVEATPVVEMPQVLTQPDVVVPPSTLVQIETDLSKANPVPSAQHNQPATTRRRARQREVYVESEPLVQIETHH
jgi:ribonuclease E